MKIGKRALEVKMLVRLRISDDLFIEEEADKEVDAFKAAARLTEIFKHDKCGRCGKTNVRFVCRRDSQENDWLEISCQNFKDCGAKLVFSTVKGKSGEIYPKTRWTHLSPTQQEQRSDEKDYADSHNGWLPNGGWYIYRKS